MKNEQRKAILIGNSTFAAAQGGLRSLRCPGRDVQEMYGVLSDPERGGYEVEVACEQTSSEVFGQIDRLLLESSKEDLILIYYTGHGLIDSNGSLFLATANTNPSLMRSTALPIGWVLDCVKSSLCQRFVLILDCCYSGAVSQQGFDHFVADPVHTTPVADPVHANLQGFSDRIAEGVGKFILTASTAIQRSYEAADGTSVFTHHLLAGLRTGEADLNRDGFVSAGELYAYLKTAMQREDKQEPACWGTGAANALVISHAPEGGSKGLRQRIALRLAKDGARLPEAIASAAAAMSDLSADELRQRSTGTIGLLLSWAQNEIETDELIERWERLRPVLPGTDRKANFRREDRWGVVREARGPVMDLGMPTYLLDSSYHFLDWNPAFDEVVARPFGLCRSQHAKDFIDRLENAAQVNARSKEVFRPGQPPLVDMETLKIRTLEFGLVTVQKIATQIPAMTERDILWCVTLNIQEAEKSDELWAAIRNRLNAEVNWSKYAVLYDRMLAPFDEYHRLVRQVTAMVGDARCCADLAAGTGNGTLELLQGHPERMVWALEANEFMLERLRTKTEAADFSQRTCIFKGDLMVSLQEFTEYFDAAIMINALYAIEERQRCLLGIYSALKPGAVLALSTSTKQTDVGQLFTAIRKTLAGKPARDGHTLLDELGPIVDEAYQRHLAMDELIHHDSQRDVVEYLETAGFQVEEVIPGAYCGAVVIVKARKPWKVVSPPAALPSLSRSEVKPPAQIFISYSHADKPWLTKMRTFLAPLADKKLIEIWDDSDIKPGHDWRKKIDQSLDRANVAVLLVSAEFLSSKFIKDEELPVIIQAANAGVVKLIWVLVSECLWNVTDLKDKQAAFPVTNPLDTLTEGECNRALTQIAKRISECLG